MPSSNISLYRFQYATAKAEHTPKNHKSKSDCFIWTDDELLMKVCIEYNTSKINGNTDWESCQELLAQQEQQKRFGWPSC